MMLYALIVFAAALAFLCAFSGYLWRSRAKEQLAVLRAVAHGVNAVGLERRSHADYVFTMKEEASAALARKDAEITTLQGRVSEVTELLKFSDEMVSSLRLQIAEKDGANAALQDFFKESSARLVGIEAGHQWHLGGKTTAHDGTIHLLYECSCGQRLTGPQGFLKLGGPA